MNHAPAETGTFIIIWVGFLALMIATISLILLWGVRSRQFENQDRARYLPLWSGIPDDETGGKEAPGAGSKDKAP